MFISHVKSTDGSFKSSDFNISKDDFSCGYVGEPEHNEEQLKSKKKMIWTKVGPKISTGVNAGIVL